MSESPTIPATFGGPGFQYRDGSHRDDLGSVWQPCGQDSEWTELRQVMMAWPPDSLEIEGDPDAHLMLEKPDLELARLQAECIADAFESEGVTVHWARPEQTPPPNFLFMRDLIFMTPSGAILARPASPVRAKEARAAAECLAKAGIPILATIHGDGLMEGADCLWVRPDLVLIGVGHRTNAAGLAQLIGLLSRMGVATRSVPVPRGAQHLLGVVVPLDHNLVAVDSERCSRALRAVFEVLDIQVIELEPSAELREQRGLNFVTLGPKKVLMPGECPTIRQILEAHGVQCVEAEVTEYVKAGGALGCLTAVIERSPWPETLFEPATEEIQTAEAEQDEQGVDDALDAPTDVSDEWDNSDEQPMESAQDATPKSDLDAPTELALDEMNLGSSSDEDSSEEVFDSDGEEPSESDDEEPSESDDEESPESDDEESADSADSADSALRDVDEPTLKDDAVAPEEKPGQPHISSEERIRFDDGDDEGWRPPSLMQLTEEVEEQDSTEVLVEWVVEESD